MSKELEKRLNANIEKMIKTLSMSCYEIAKSGYRIWLKQNTHKTMIEKLEFKKKYVGAYVDDKYKTI